MTRSEASRRIVNKLIIAFTKNYDSHIALKHLTKQFPDERIQVIANNQEKYTAFEMGHSDLLILSNFLGAVWIRLLAI